MAESLLQLLPQLMTDVYLSQANLEDNVNLLRKNIEELKSMALDMKEKLNSAEVVYGKKPKRVVLLCLQNIQEITDEMPEIEEEFRGQGRRFSLSRVDFGKFVIKKIQETVKPIEKSQFSDGLFADMLPDSGRMPTTELVGVMNLEKISKSLMDTEVGIIGVYGIEGIGKTAVMSHIHNMLKDDSIFNSVIWVTVSRNSHLKRLQNDIAREIGVQLLEEENEMGRARKLFQALTRRMKFILILDDMREAFPLEKIGIPKPNKENGCKLVLISRSLDLCIDMYCQKKLKVELLSQDDAFQLFKEKLGTDVEVTPEVEPYARGVAEECGGFPPQIIEIAMAMTKNVARGKAMLEMSLVSMWKYAHEELKNSTTIRQQYVKMPLRPWFLEDEDGKEHGTKRKAVGQPTVTSPPMTLEDQEGCGKKRKVKDPSYFASTSQSPSSP